MPASAAKLLLYQYIITSASIQYPTAAWLNYDLQLCTLAALDPSSIGMYDTLTYSFNSRQAYTTCTLAMQAL